MDDRLPEPSVGRRCGGARWGGCGGCRHAGVEQEAALRKNGLEPLRGLDRVVALQQLADVLHRGAFGDLVLRRRFGVVRTTGEPGGDKAPIGGGMREDRHEMALDIARNVQP